MERWTPDRYNSMVVPSTDRKVTEYTQSHLSRIRQRWKHHCLFHGVHHYLPQFLNAKQIRNITTTITLTYME